MDRNFGLDDDVKNEDCNEKEANKCKLLRLWRLDAKEITYHAKIGRDLGVD